MDERSLVVGLVHIWYRGLCEYVSHVFLCQAHTCVSHINQCWGLLYQLKFVSMEYTRYIVEKEKQQVLTLIHHMRPHLGTLSRFPVMVIVAHLFSKCCRKANHFGARPRPCQEGSLLMV